MTLALCSYSIYVQFVNFLSSSAWFFSLFGVQYIIYLFDGEYNKMNCFTLFVKVIELTCFIVLITFATQRGGTKALLIFIFICVLRAFSGRNFCVHKDACSYLEVFLLNRDIKGLKAAIFCLSQCFTTLLNRFHLRTSTSPRRF